MQRSNSLNPNPTFGSAVLGCARAIQVESASAPPSQRLVFSL